MGAVCARRGLSLSSVLAQFRLMMGPVGALDDSEDAIRSSRTRGPIYNLKGRPPGFEPATMWAHDFQLGPDALPTGLQLHSALIFAPVLNNGPNRGTSTKARFKNGAPKRVASIEAPAPGLAPEICPLKFDL